MTILRTYRADYVDRTLTWTSPVLQLPSVAKSGGHRCGNHGRACSLELVEALLAVTRPPGEYDSLVTRQIIQTGQIFIRMQA